jgi:hypothetical protein
LAAPQVGFGDASEQEIAEIRGGSYLETVDDNPVYNFQYKVADEEEQTYIAMDEERAGDTVTGSYSYVDPYGSLITVNYIAGAMGYTETRDVQENFVTIRARPVRTQSVQSVNALAAAEAARIEQQRAAQLEAQRRQAEEAAAESARFAAIRWVEAAAAAEAARQEAARQEAARFEAAESARLEAIRIEEERRAAEAAEAARLEAIRIEQELNAAAAAEAAAAAAAEAAAEAARLEAARLEALRLEQEAAANSQADIIKLILSQIQPLVGNAVSSAVSGQQSQNSVSSGGRFSAGGRPVARVRVPVPARQPVPAPSARAQVTNVFGEGGDYNVRFHTPDFKIEY